MVDDLNARPLHAYGRERWPLTLSHGVRSLNESTEWLTACSARIWSSKRSNKIANQMKWSVVSWWIDDAHRRNPIWGINEKRAPPSKRHRKWCDSDVNRRRRWWREAIWTNWSITGAMQTDVCVVKPEIALCFDAEKLCAPRAEQIGIFNQLLSRRIHPLYTARLLYLC